MPLPTTEEFERQGVPADKARRLAFARFGGVTKTWKPIGIGADSAFRQLGQDLAYAVRRLIRAPGFAIVAILTLAIGILGSTTIFSGVNALLFTPLPAESPEQIAQVVLDRRRGPPDFGAPRRPVHAKHGTPRQHLVVCGAGHIKDVTVPISGHTKLIGGERSSTRASSAGKSPAELYFDTLGIRPRRAGLYTG